MAVHSGQRQSAMRRGKKAAGKHAAAAVPVVTANIDVELDKLLSLLREQIHELEEIYRGMASQDQSTLEIIGHATNITEGHYGYHLHPDRAVAQLLTTVCEQHRVEPFWDPQKLAAGETVVAKTADVFWSTWEQLEGQGKQHHSAVLTRAAQDNVPGDRCTSSFDNEYPRSRRLSDAVVRVLEDYRRLVSVSPHRKELERLSALTGERATRIRNWMYRQRKADRMKCDSSGTSLAKTTHDNDDDAEQEYDDDDDGDEENEQQDESEAEYECHSETATSPLQHVDDEALPTRSRRQPFALRAASSAGISDIATSFPSPNMSGAAYHADFETLLSAGEHNTKIYREWHDDMATSVGAMEGGGAGVAAGTTTLMTHMEEGSEFRLEDLIHSDFLTHDQE